jgi:hypothetical protein
VPATGPRTAPEVPPRFARRSAVPVTGRAWTASHSTTYATPGRPWRASAGATLKDLMKRLGHSSSAAATRYLHAVDGRDAEIAAALSELARGGTAAKLPRSLR